VAILFVHVHFTPDRRRLRDQWEAVQNKNSYRLATYLAQGLARDSANPQTRSTAALAQIGKHVRKTAKSIMKEFKLEQPWLVTVGLLTPSSHVDVDTPEPVKWIIDTSLAASDNLHIIRGTSDDRDQKREAAPAPDPIASAGSGPQGALPQGASPDDDHDRTHKLFQLASHSFDYFAMCNTLAMKGIRDALNARGFTPNGATNAISAVSSQTPDAPRCQSDLCMHACMHMHVRMQVTHRDASAGIDMSAHGLGPVPLHLPPLPALDMPAHMATLPHASAAAASAAASEGPDPREFKAAAACVSTRVFLFAVCVSVCSRDRAIALTSLEISHGHGRVHGIRARTRARE
jgi:hypothetical protein